MSVSTDHYIGGQRVGSPTTFEDRSPLDWSSKLADVARGDAHTADLAVRAAVDAFPEWAAMGVKGRGDIMRRVADLIDEHVPSLAAVECLDMAMLEESLRLRVLVARRPQLPRLRRPRRAVRRARVEQQRHGQPRDAHARRRHRGDHAVERAVHAQHVEVRAGAGGRQHGHPQAGRVEPSVVQPARRPVPRSGHAARCVQRRAGHRRGSGRGAGERPSPEADQLHRFTRDRPPHRHRGRARTSCRSPPNWGAKARSWCSPMPISTWQRRRRRGSTTTPARCAWPAPACSWRRAFATSSCGCSTTTPTSTCWATRATRPPPSAR